MKSIKRTFVIGVFMLLAVNALILYFSMFIVKWNLKMYLSNRNDAVLESVSTMIEHYYNEKNALLKTILRLMETGVLRTKEETLDFINAETNEYRVFADLMILDTNGVVIYASEHIANSIGYNYQNAQFFTFPRQTGKVYWSKSFISNETDDATVTVSLASKHYVIAAYLNLNLIEEEVVHVIKNRRFVIEILDKHGVYIISRNKQNVEEMVVNRDILERVEKSPSGIFFNIDNNKRNIVVYKYMKSINWILMINQHEEDLYYIIHNIYGIQIIMITVLVIMMAILARVLVKSLTTSLNGFVKKMENISYGRYTEEQLFSEFTEFSLMSSIFNKMRDSVKLREENIRKSETRFRTLTENVPVGIAVASLGGDISFLNGKFMKMFGYSRADLGDIYDWFSFAFPDAEYRKKCLEMWNDDINRGLDSRTVVPAKIYKAQSKNGVRLNVEVSFAIVDDQLYVVFNDITDVTMMGVELAQTKNFLDMIINAMPSKIITVDANLKIIHLNEFALKMANTSKEEVVGKVVTSVYDMYPEMDTMIVEAMKSGESCSLEGILIKDSNKKTIFEDILIYPLAQEGAVIRIDNVTEKISFQETMVQTEKMVTIGELAAGMAHEINNPLAAVLQGVQNSLRRLSPDLDANRDAAGELGLSLENIHAYLEKRNIFKYLNGISESGKRAAFIVSNMLNFSRKSEGRMDLYNVNEIIDFTINLIENEYDLGKNYDFKKIRISRNYDQELHPLRMKRMEIEQVLVNLFKNSAHSIYEKTMLLQGKNPPVEYVPEISITTTHTPLTVEIEIRDNGNGMPEEVRKRVFEPFYTTKEVGVGTGLGLTVTYFIITENHKGRISVESEEGEGATFHIYLPYQDGESSEA